MDFRFKPSPEQIGVFRVTALAAARTLATNPNGSDLRQLQGLITDWQTMAKSTQDLLFLKLVWYILEEIQHDVLDRLWVRDEAECLRERANQVSQALTALARYDCTLKLEHFYELAEIHRDFMRTVGISDAPPAAP